MFGVEMNHKGPEQEPVFPRVFTMTEAEAEVAIQQYITDFQSYVHHNHALYRRQRPLMKACQILMCVLGRKENHFTWCNYKVWEKYYNRAK